MGAVKKGFKYLPKPPTIYTPTKHFIQRYKERILKNDLKKDKILKYINNFKKNIIFYKEIEYKGEVQHVYIYIPKPHALSGTPQWVVADPKTKKLVTLFKKKGLFEEDWRDNFGA